MAESKSEGKYSEAKKSQKDLWELVQDYCISSEFENKFEEFAKEHAHVFLAEFEGKDSGTLTEYPHEYYEVYKKYLNIFESLIENFITKVKIHNLKN
jgi:hypothetical protein